MSSTRVWCVIERLSFPRRTFTRLVLSRKTGMFAPSTFLKSLATISSMPCLRHSNGTIDHFCITQKAHTELHDVQLCHTLDTEVSGRCLRTSSVLAVCLAHIVRSSPLQSA